MPDIVRNVPMGRFRRQLAIALLLLSLLASTVSAKAADPLETAAGAYLNSYNLGMDALEAADFDTALALQDPLRELYAKVLAIALDVCNCEADEAYALKMSTQSYYMRLTMLLGQGLYDAGRFAEALAVYDKGQAVNAEYPCLRYEKGFTFVALKQPDAAAIELYEAKRLARFPSRSSVPNHFSEGEDVVCPRAEVDRSSDGLLAGLGKPLNYPLGRDLASGRAMPGRIVPGMGLQFEKQGHLFDIYLEESVASILQKLGEPDRREHWRMMGEYLPYLIYGDLRIALDAGGERVKFLHLASPGRALLTPRGYLETGATAEQVRALLGQDYGFRHGEEKDPARPMKEFLDYTELGVVFHIDRQDRVALISLYAPI